jgi:hypothetical protein
MVEPENVSLEKPLEVPGRFGNAMRLKKFAHKAHIRPSGEFQSLESFRRAEFRRENFRERLHSGAARANKRAVNIEQSQTNHRRKIAVTRRH